MQIIKPLLTNNIRPLGVISSLSNTYRPIFRKESDFLHSRSNFLSPIQTKSPLATSSQFLLSRELEPSIQPVIDWDNWDNPDIDGGFPFIDFDPFESIDSEEHNNVNSTELVKSDISHIVPNVVDNNIINEASPEINIKKPNKNTIQTKKKSKSTNKSQQQSKSKIKSTPKKSVKSSAAKNVVQADDKNNQDNFIASNEPLFAEVNGDIRQTTDENHILKSQTPDSLNILSLLDENNYSTNSQEDTTLKTTTIDIDDVSNTTPNIMPSTRSDVQEKSSLFKNVANEESQLISDLPSSVSSVELSTSETISSLRKNHQLDENTGELADNSLREFSLPHNVEKQQVVAQDIPTTQFSQKTDISDIAVSPTPIQPDIPTDEFTSQVDNKNPNSPKNIIQKKEISPIINPASSEQESLNKNNNFKAITAIEPDSEKNTINTNNHLENLPLSSAVTSPDIDDAPTLVHHLANDENTVPSAVIDNFESSVTKTPIVVQQEIDSSLTTESLASAPVQLMPNSANTEDTSNFFSKSENDKQLVNSESHSTVAVNVSDIPANIISLQPDKNLENTISESIETQRILFPDEIVEAPKFSNISPEILEAPKINNISPEIVESPKINNISPEIIESSNVEETSNIFRKIVDSEPIVESELLGAIANSENPEISTFIDIPEQPTFPPNQFQQNTTIENLPAPKGYATGGQVTDSELENNQHIAPSDTIPAMLTPGEFVINTRDAQKNLPLLQHINSGGTPDNIILPSLQTPDAEEAKKTTPQSSTKVDSFPDTSLQLKPQESNSLIPTSLGFNVGKQKLSILNSPQLNTVAHQTNDTPVTSPQYSSPPLIFRKANSPTQTPSQWSSVQELFNDNNDEFTSFFSGGESNNQNSAFSDVFTSSEYSQNFAKHHAAPRGFAEGGEVTTPASENTETAQNTSGTNEEDNKDDTADLEALACEIYSRLRQRLEIERERHGGHSGRLSW